MTVTGLNSVLVAPLARSQQGILFLLMSIGSTSVVSLVTILIRRHFFRKAFANLVATDDRTRRRLQALEMAEEKEAARHPRHPKSLYRRVVRRVRPDGRDEKDERPKEKGKRGKLTADMIRRVDDPSDASRHLSNGGELLESERRRVSDGDLKVDGGLARIISDEPDEMESSEESRPREPSPMNTWPRRGSEPTAVHHHTGIPFDRSKTHEPVLTSARPNGVPHSMTIEFAPDEPDLRRRAIANAHRAESPESAPSRMPRTRTISTGHRDTKLGGFGGPPNPLAWAFRFVRDRLPGEHEVWARQASTAMHRSTTQGTMLRRTGTVSSAFAGRTATKPAPYITVRPIPPALLTPQFDADIGRNSRFKRLTASQQAELGGVEYRALTTLFWIVLAYILGWQLIMCAILSPYLSRNEFSPIFDGPGGTNPTWFTFFQIWSAWSNNGMVF